MSQQRKVIVTKDADNFTESECDCHLCKDMNKTAAGSDFVPTTNVQKRLLAVIKKYDTSRPVKKRKRKE